MATSPDRSTALPGRWKALSELSTGTQGRVLLVERDGVRGVLRLAPADGDDAGRAIEFAVLAHVDHPGLARLVDHGYHAATRELYLVRAWIDGVDLAEHAGEMRRRASDPARELASLVTRSLPALEHLHRAGFVHSDFKATNVIVEKSGAPILTDFGLARARAASVARAPRATDGVSGTLYALAPEVLLGLPPDPRSDLFAVGVLLHELLLARRASARQFYARFPDVDFFAASQTRVDDLPEWARDIVSRLLERDPERRPESALELGRQLGARLGLALSNLEPPRPIWRVRRGRQEFVEAWIEAVREDFARSSTQRGAAGALAPRWVRIHAGESASAVLEDLRLGLALAGSPVQLLELAPLATAAGNARAVDRWQQERARAAGGTVLLTALASDDSLGRRVSTGLARALRQAARAADAEPALLVVVSDAAPPESDAGWTVDVLPPIERASIDAFVAESFEDAAARRTELADWLEREARGNALGLDRALERLHAQGALLAGERRARLRPGPFTSPEAADASRADWANTPEAQRGILAALFLLGGRARAAQIAERVELANAELSSAIDALQRAGRIALEAARDGVEVVERERFPARGFLDERRWCALCARHATLLSAGGASPAASLAFSWRAAPQGAQAERLIDELRSARENGFPERALALYESARSLALVGPISLPAEAHAECGQAWIAAGQPERALALVEELEAGSSAGGSPLVRARCERIRAAVAIVRHEWPQALEHFARAEQLDPADAGEVLYGRALLFYEAWRETELDELCSAAHARGTAALPPRRLAAIDNVRAMSLFRRGAVDEARKLLQRLLEEARADGDPGREAGVRINLATLARRTGDLDRAREHAERAAALYEELGHLPGLAQTRALLGGILREAGELERAGALFALAQELRERLGDVAGAATVRGMCGLLAADRGHLRVAQQELEGSAAALRAAGLAGLALVLEARAHEVRARFESARDGAPAVGGDAARLVEADPRGLIALARAAWLRGTNSIAAAQAERARALAQRVSQPLPEAEARFLLDLLRRTGERGIAAEAAAPLADETRVARLVDEDRRLLALLSGDLGPREASAAALEWARELLARGRDDRAARLALGVAARTSDAASATLARSLLQAALVRCMAGLSADEARAATASLLAIPDPWPGDLRAGIEREPSAEENDMDVIALLEINRRLVKQEALRDLLGAIVESALSVTHAERGFLVLEEDGELSFDTALDSRRGDITAPDLEISKSIVHETLREGRVLRLSNVLDDPLLGSAPSVSALELRSILCAPFVVDEHLRGVIYLDHRLQQSAFAERAERLLALLADQAALAIRQVRRLEEIKRLNRELKSQVVRRESELRTAQAVLRDAHLSLPAGGMVGSSPPMRAVHRLIERAAPSKLAVLVTGESGTGKELVAQALHALSPRRSGPFVSENCAALPASLIESEIFGYRKGAFTGADSDRAGMFERAEGGTMFLDEIGELALELQAKLLRVLETSEVRRVGDSKVRPVDFRLIAATNRDLESEVRAGRFRADLFYRLDGLRITLPTLAQRVEDIPELVDHFLRLESARSGAKKSIAPAVVTRLCRREWAGNVRELANEISRLWVLSEGDIVDPELVRAGASTALSGGGAASAGSDASLLGPPSTTMEEIEKRAILRAIELSGGDKRAAAELLGISRAKVYQRLKDWRIDGAGGDNP